MFNFDGNGKLHWMWLQSLFCILIQLITRPLNNRLVPLFLKCALLVFISSIRLPLSKSTSITMKSSLQGSFPFIISIFRSLDFWQVAPTWSSMSEMFDWSRNPYKCSIRSLASPVSGSSSLRRVKFCCMHNTHSAKI